MKKFLFLFLIGCILFPPVVPVVFGSSSTKFELRIEPLVPPGGTTIHGGSSVGTGTRINPSPIPLPALTPEYLQKLLPDFDKDKIIIYKRDVPVGSRTNRHLDITDDGVTDGKRNLFDISVGNPSVIDDQHIASSIADIGKNILLKLGVAIRETVVLARNFILAQVWFVAKLIFVF